MKSLDHPDINGIQLVSYDFTRAFDKLCHSTIIDRLQQINAPIEFIAWLCSYLKDRTQSVKIGNSISASASVLSGVPQGSILGPFLFSLVIATYNPITDHTLVVKFADDIISAFPLFKNSDNSYIHDEHAGLLNWSNKNNLILHPDKSKSLTISHCNNTDVNSVSLNKVQEVDSVKLLGVIFSSNCSWKKHISNIVSTASRKLHILRVLKKFLPKSELINVYFASIRSSLE